MPNEAALCTVSFCDTAIILRNNNNHIVAFFFLYSE